MLVLSLNRESREKRERFRRCNPAPLQQMQGDPFGSFASLFRGNRNGKAAKRQGKPEDLPVS